ncbi:MAG: hypothetical protein LBK12_09185 [Odoribacteraceae bacterium]|jgi:hypothetical protein|nr:hypothetical protein [Odoribacteraceae bacterium]
MSTVLLLMALFALLKATLVTSLFPGAWEKVAWGAACAAFVAATHPFAIEGSKVAVERTLSGVDATMDVSAVVMIDLLLLAGFCHALSRERRPRGVLLVARYLPGILVFPALYYLHLTLFFRLPGTGFVTVTGFYAAVAGLCVGGGGWLLSRWLPGREARLELTAVVALLVFALSVCCTVFHPSAMIRSAGGPVDWRALAVALAVAGVLFLTGYTCRKLRITNYELRKKSRDSSPS